jgi:hypothetical protein
MLERYTFNAETYIFNAETSKKKCYPILLLDSIFIQMF